MQRAVNDGAFTTIATLDPTASDYSDVGLRENTQYSYQLISVTPSGNVVSASTTATTPLAVDTLQGLAVSANEVDLSWSNNSTEASAFQLDRSADGGATWISLPPPPMSGTDVPAQYEDLGASPDTDYLYRVRAVEAAGPTQFAYSTDVHTPSAVSITEDAGLLSAVSNGTGEIDLSWTVSDPGITNPELQRSVDGVNFATILDIGPGATTYADTNLVDGTGYYYQLIGVAPSGGEAASSVISAATDMAAPSDVTATPIPGQGIQLEWTGNSAVSTGFDVERADGPGGAFSPIELDEENIDETTLPGQTYSYRVAAISDTVESAPSATVQAIGPVGDIVAVDDTPNNGVIYSALNAQPLTLYGSNLVSNDQDPNNGAQFMRVASTTQPAHGTLVDNGDGTFTYTASLGYFGTDTFTYTPTDQYGASANPASVEIQVTYIPPQATSITVGCATGASVTGSLVGANSTAPEQSATDDQHSFFNPDTVPLTFSIQTGPTNGTVSISGGKFTYTAPEWFTGVDTFTYIANAGVQNSNIASVTVVVEPGMVTFSGAIDGSDYLHIKGNQFWIVHRNWYPAGQYPGLGDPNLYVDGVPGDTYKTWTISPTLGQATPVTVIKSGRGAVTVTQQPSESNGYETVVLINDDPPPGPWWYWVGVMPASVTPPIVLQDSSRFLETQEDQTISTSSSIPNLVASNAAANPNISGLAVAQVTDGNPAASARQLTLSSDGNFSYTPPTGFVGTDWFTYLMTDAAGAASMYATVFVNVVSPAPYSIKGPDYVALQPNATATVSLNGGAASDTAVWTSSDPSVLKVADILYHRTQTLLPVAPGVVTLTAKVPGVPAITKTITVVKAQIDPVVPYLDKGTQGTLMPPDINGNQLNQILNPAAIVIPGAGGPSVGTVATVRLTDIEPLKFDPGVDDPNIVWTIAPDGPNGGSAAFYKEHPKGQGDPSGGTLGYGSEVRLYGVKPGRILLTAKLVPGGGGQPVVLDTYQALVTNVVERPYRVQLLSNQVTAEQAAKEIAITNTFLWQAGVTLIPDDGPPIVGNGIQPVAAKAAIFTYKDYDQSTLDVDLGTSRTVGDKLIGANFKPNVWNIVYVNKLVNSADGDILGGNAIAVPKLRNLGKNGFNVTLTYRIVLQDNNPPGGTPHTMHLNNGRMGGVQFGNYGMLVSSTAGLSQISIGRTIAHETGHYFNLAHRDQPAVLGAGGAGVFFDNNSDGLSQPHDLNIMDVPIDDKGNPLPTDNRDDLDLIQTYVLHGQRPQS